MKYTHMYVGDDGESHFKVMDFEEKSQEDGVASLLIAPASTAQLWRIPSQYEQDWSGESSILVVMVSGDVVVTTSDGEARHFRAGDIVRIDDSTSQGHLLRGGESECLLLLVKLTV